MTLQAGYQMRKEQGSMRRLILVVSLTALYVVGCKGSIPEGKPRQEAEERIREAVFRYLMTTHRGQEVYFLSLGARTDPDDVFMERFSGNEPPVRKVSQAKVTAVSPIDEQTNEEGIILTVTDIRWLNRNAVEVRWAYYKHAANSSGGACMVLRDGDVWAVSRQLESWEA